MDIIKYIRNAFEEFIKFTVDNGVFTLIIAAIVSIAISNLVSSIKTNIIDYYLNKIFRTTNNNLIALFTSILQFILILYGLYVFYNLFFKHIILRYQRNQGSDMQWKNAVLTELRELNTNFHHQ